MQVHQIMSSPAQTIGSDQTIGAATLLMKQFDIGSLPVLQSGGRVVGMITDRDIVLGLAKNASAQLSMEVGRMMTRSVLRCYADQSIETIAVIMSDNQVRRLPVMDRFERLVGVVSVGDIAEDASERLAGEILGEIVETR
ncbi:MAG: CBS domain-containing protein [Roseitalea sp.]|jgi:CBS domain-containing protein|uniref:CBS domain-containing protein n=1 Tax=Oceaniradius stylonematis TaxID=2184161 RepID=UPI001B21E7A9|nr:CBS domain-containing protein [Oceaniradius stylonematis]MBO6551687.1 CBS domain-containing protein [Roseitalea sp.]MBO6951933.1 CBS domain-containing protein [Rhizobiaceae bacterium]MBO6592221.1 CBS domain-containing protein [Roseitalea sp.]MBO6598476.1 CBS domain-containing protein [Roseitalea sp.]MBO6610922.1 CBS domain-containing protein [Roseitalea sp.]